MTDRVTEPYRLQLTNGQYLYSHSQVRIKKAIVETGCSNCRFGNTNPDTLAFTADEAFQGIAGRGFITIHYRDADLGLRRPLIIVEGFDAGHITSPELQFGTSTRLDFFRNVDDQSSGSPALENVITNFPEYDIIYVDWRNGTDFLQRNGLLLQTIIRWVNANKEPSPGGGFADNVILGQSMGGVISRWALRDMETRLGQQHNTRMFISMDAPQQGANVPAAYQHLARHARSIYLQTGLTAGITEAIQFFSNGISPFRALSIADRPASRQMLINWVNSSGNIDNTMHDQWQTELRNLGYPTQDNIRNIAISNGAECGTTQPFAPGAELLNINGKANTRFLGDLLGQIAFPLAGVFLGQGAFYLGVLPGRNDLKFEFIANAQPEQGVTQRIYKGKISYTKKILWLIPVNITITDRERNNNSSLLPTDYYAGGEINTGVNNTDINIQNVLIKFNMSLTHIPTFCFIPTPSALDIGLNNIVLNNADYLARYIGGAPPTPPKNTPFQNFVTAFNNQRRNEQHIGFFQRNGDWLAQELTQVGNPPPNPPIANCSDFCNLQISADNQICSGSQVSVPVIVGPTTTITWSASPAGIVQFGCSTCSQTSVTGNGTVTLTATITSNCGNFVITRQTTVVSVPQPPTITGLNYDRFCGTYVEAGSTSAGATNYIWNLNYGQVTGEGDYFYQAPLVYNPTVGFTYYNYLSVQAQNACGLSDPTTVSLTVGPVPARCGGGMQIMLSPNPTTSNVTVQTTDDSKFTRLRIVDKIGQVKKQFNYAATKKVTFSVADLPADVYRIQALINNNWTTVSFIKQ